MFDIFVEGMLTSRYFLKENKCQILLFDYIYFTVHTQLLSRVLHILRKTIEGY